ncbi:MAG: hypothetical protein L6R19_21995 [Alphaproteobacteria bacterium]|nr:hypothetical protein [Alphaproteobacteria bacterium]
MSRSTSAARLAGFDRIELTATLTGRRVCRRRGYAEHAPTALRLPDGVLFPVVPMDKRLGPGAVILGAAAARRVEPDARRADVPHRPAPAGPAAEAGRVEGESSRLQPRPADSYVGAPS